jgi:outer membrane protein OmpA-like peptidoglycan-associated protein
MSRRIDTGWIHWSSPINLGPSVNTADQDWELFIPASGDYAYLASRQGAAGGLDIFRIKLPDALRPQPVVLVSGQVLDQKTKRPVAATIIYEILSSGDAAGVAASDPTNGNYGVVLPSGSSYGFYAEADGYIPVSDNLDLNDLKEYREVQRNLYLVPIEKGQTIRLNNLFFDTGESTLRPESLPELNRVVQLLKKYPTMTIEVRGHTDDVGSAESNKKLSLDRATAVRSYLQEKGIAAARMTAKGFGSTKPVVANTSDEARQQNRRVEFTITKK